MAQQSQDPIFPELDDAFAGLRRELSSPVVRWAVALPLLAYLLGLI